jgi:hypothetical protein
MLSLRGQIGRRVPRNRSGAGLGRVPELPMTAAGARQFPAIRLDHLDDIPDLHSTYSVPSFVSSATGTARDERLKTYSTRRDATREMSLGYQNRSISMSEMPASDTICLVVEKE